MDKKLISTIYTIDSDDVDNKLKGANANYVFSIILSTWVCIHSNHI